MNIRILKRGRWVQGYKGEDRERETIGDGTRGTGTRGKDRGEGNYVIR